MVASSLEENLANVSKWPFMVCKKKLVEIFIYLPDLLNRLNLTIYQKQVSTKISKRSANFLKKIEELPIRYSVNFLPIYITISKI